MSNDYPDQTTRGDQEQAPAVMDGKPAGMTSDKDAVAGTGKRR